jgi:hypothetical protein
MPYPTYLPYPTDLTHATYLAYLTYPPYLTNLAKQSPSASSSSQKISAFLTRPIVTSGRSPS